MASFCNLDAFLLSIGWRTLDRSQSGGIENRPTTGRRRGVMSDPNFKYPFKKNWVKIAKNDSGNLNFQMDLERQLFVDRIPTVVQKDCLNLEFLELMVI